MIRKSIQELTPQRLFLIDSIGAFISAILLGVVLVALNNFVGMPVYLLYILAIIAMMLGIYSFLNYCHLKCNWKSRLRIIAMMNMLYCSLTFILILMHLKVLTLWGIIYFTTEILIIVTLAVTEWRMAATLDNGFG